MSANDFIAPTDLTQACSLLSSEINQTVILAGGTDLMARFNRHRRKRSERIVFLGKLGLDYKFAHYSGKSFACPGGERSSHQALIPYSDT